MKKAYCAIGYATRKNFNQEIQSITHLFSSLGIELLVFVDRYHFKDNEEKEMMTTAFNEIDSCDFLIAELSAKSIGVGIEIGYAYATQKPILYLRKEGTAYSTTAAGCSSHSIVYKNPNDLMEKLRVILHSIKAL